RARLLGWTTLAGMPREQEPSPDRQRQRDADSRHDQPVRREIHQRSLPSHVCAIAIRFSPRATQMAMCGQSDTVPLTDGTMTPARMAPAPRLFNAVANSLTRSL